MALKQSFFDQAERKKQEGIEVAYQNANSIWKAAAAKRMYSLAKLRRTFTSEDILMYLEERGIVTGNNKAISGVLQAGARSGLIRASDKFVRSRRPQRHAAPIMVWDSLIFRVRKRVQ